MAALEKHFSPRELGELWGMSNDSIIRLFKHEPGVLRLAPPKRRGTRTKVTLRIPESVIAAVYERSRNK